MSNNATAKTSLVDLLSYTFNFNVLYEDSKHKSEICRAAYHQTKACRFGDQCDFAHTVIELSPRVFDHINFKKAVCSKWNSGCPYQTRCLYIHDEKKFQLNDRISILHSVSESKFRIIRDQGNGTVCVFTLDTDSTPRDDLGRKVLKSVWNYVRGDFKALAVSAHLVPNQQSGGACKRSDPRRKREALKPNKRTPTKPNKRKAKHASPVIPRQTKKKSPFLKRLSPALKKVSPPKQKLNTFGPSSVKVKSFVPSSAQAPPQMMKEDPAKPEKPPVVFDGGAKSRTEPETQFQQYSNNPYQSQECYHTNNPYLPSFQPQHHCSSYVDNRHYESQYSPPSQMFQPEFSPPTYASQPYMAPPPLHHSPLMRQQYQQEMHESYVHPLYNPSIGVTMPPSPPLSPKHCLLDKDIDQKENSPCRSLASEKVLNPIEPDSVLKGFDSDTALKSGVFGADLNQIKEEDTLKYMIKQLRSQCSDHDVAMARLSKENAKLWVNNRQLSKNSEDIRVCSVSPPPEQFHEGEGGTNWYGDQHFPPTSMYYGKNLSQQTNPYAFTDYPPFEPEEGLSNQGNPPYNQPWIPA